MNYLRRHGELFLAVIVCITAALWGIAQFCQPLSPAYKILMFAMLIFWIPSFAYCVFKSEFPFFRRYKQTIGLTILVAYVIILGLATISEIFELDWFNWV